MGAAVFGNEFFDQWLTQKSNEILSKVEREKISNEDMLILSLKAQVNHFHHMDIEFRDEFKSIQGQFKDVQKNFEKVDQRFDRLTTILMWAFGIFSTIQLGMFYRLLQM